VKEQCVGVFVGLAGEQAGGRVAVVVDEKLVHRIALGRGLLDLDFQIAHLA
jgi:hypothetical protein